MPKTRVVTFADAEGHAPFVLWLDQQPAKVQDKVIVRVDLLEAHGHELRRPHADFLRDGIYELRAAYARVQYRVLYFFHQQTAVLSHGLTKEDVVPPLEIDRALRHKSQFQHDPATHTLREVAD